MRETRRKSAREAVPGLHTNTGVKIRARNQPERRTFNRMMEERGFERRQAKVHGISCKAWDRHSAKGTR